ncbi:hypothetical protein [Actinacidiphila glaucinigra]|uniref:hypothetical protein n=1 Tax=Actinacidiphila glaucinigra TaxID=235986 RepID=UPI0038278229
MSFSEAATGKLKFDPHEQLIVRQIDETEAELDRIRAALADADLVIPGSTGQETANKLLDEARKHRLLLLSLIKALNIPADDAGSALTPIQQAERRRASEMGRAAAERRWGTRG